MIENNLREFMEGIVMNMNDKENYDFSKKPVTRLTYKNFSPMIVRKYHIFGMPTYIGIICDTNLDDLDNLITEENFNLEDSIQSIRDLSAIISERIVKYYNNKKASSLEAVGVLIYADKMMVSSLWGDFMHHQMCREEFYSIVRIMTML